MKKILVVDDEKSVRDIIKLYLSTEGFSVITAENGSLAIAIAKKERPDAIILDGIMPKMSGYVVANLLKKDQETKSMPILLLTSSGPVSTGISFQSPTPYQLAKPIKPEKLVKTVWQMLEGVK